MASSVFIDLSPAIPQALIAACTPADDKIKAALAQAVAKEDWAAFVRDIAQPALALLMGSSGEQGTANAETAYSLIFLTLRRVQQASDRERLTNELCESLLSYLDRPKATLRILTSMFFATELKFRVFITIANFVAKANVTQAVDLESGLELAGTDVAKLREANLALSAATRKTDVKKSQGYLVAFLATFSAADAAQALPQAKEAAFNAIRDPLAAREYEILRLAPIANLAKADPLLFKLLTIVCTGSIHDLKAFLSAGNSALLKDTGIEVSEVQDKMRILSFSSLAAGSDNFSYAQAASAMAVDKKEVETWVIRAISARLVECRMDQDKELIAVSTSAQRASADVQWSTIAEQLKRWRASVRSVLNTMQAAQEQQARMLAGEAE